MPLEEIKQNRIEKLGNLRKKSINPYPSETLKTDSIGDILRNFDKLVKDRKIITVAGRLMARRKHGASSFGNLMDFSGSIQVYFKKDSLGEEDYRNFLENFDIGDFLEISGKSFITKKGERTIEAGKIKILAKSILPLPEKWHGLKDIEERFRKRYLDLIMNKGVKEKFLLRIKIIDSIQNFLNKEGFLRVETPMLQVLPGGATAKPFKTKLNTLDLDLYLRIAPELYLKRLLVGGFEKIYEIGRCFRNEGMDATHNPEFTMLELYWAYQDYLGLMEFVEKMFRNVLRDIFGKEKVVYNEKTIDFSKPFERVEFIDLIKKETGLDYFEASAEDLLRKAEKMGLQVQVTEKGKIADEIIKKSVLPKLIQPTFIINHPVEISPFAKKLDNDSRRTQRFQLIIAGKFEIVNGFSELNDSIDQKERFLVQEKMRQAGDEESHRMDEDFIEALEYGMPPTAGFGIGIDRLIMLLTNSHSIREVIFFPTMKPKE